MEDLLINSYCAEDHFKCNDNFISSQKTIYGHLKRLIYYKHSYRQYGSHGYTIYDKDISSKSHEFFDIVTAR